MSCISNRLLIHIHIVKPVLNGFLIILYLKIWDKILWSRFFSTSYVFIKTLSLHSADCSTMFCCIVFERWVYPLDSIHIFIVMTGGCVETTFFVFIFQYFILVLEQSFVAMVFFCHIYDSHEWTNQNICIQNVTIFSVFNIDEEKQ